VAGEVAEQEIAPLLFIPFLENSFKHGLNNQITGGYVTIRMQVEKAELTFFIENSKAGTMLKPDLSRRSGGIGLVNVRRRLDLIYPGHYTLDIEDSPKSYAVNLTLSLN
jgi:two-component system, LytTR family, sensor kinase